MSEAPKFTSKKGDIQQLGGGVELHPKDMFRNGELVEVRHSLRTKDGVSVSFTSVLADWFQPVHKHLRTVEATTVLAGRALGISFATLQLPNIVYYKVGDVISDEIGVAHTLFVSKGTRLSTNKFLTEQAEGLPDWHAQPQWDRFLVDWSMDRMLRQAGITPEEFYS